jgi:uncharacterized OB-fold protein
VNAGTGARGVRLRPGRVVAGRRQEGPDEDALTLAIEAADRLLDGTTTPPIDRVHWFSATMPTGTADIVGAALGVPPGSVSLHPDRRSELETTRRAQTGGAPDSALWLFSSTDNRADATAVAWRGPLEAPSGSGAHGGIDGDGAASQWANALDSLPTIDHPFDPSSAAAVPAFELPLLDQRSEGAYVPRPRYIENLPSRLRFAADRCANCGVVTFPIRGYCRGCGAADRLVRVELPRQGGEVLAVTTIHSGAQPTEFDWWVSARGPYDVALVEIAPGVRVTLQVTDAPPGQVRPGDHVRTTVRRLYPMEGEWRYGRKAVPGSTR